MFRDVAGGAACGVARVLRGGSWNNESDNARADNRNDNDPDNRPSVGGSATPLTRR